jgi:hypothetical protein
MVELPCHGLDGTPPCASRLGPPRRPDLVPPPIKAAVVEVAHAAVPPVGAARGGGRVAGGSVAPEARGSSGPAPGAREEVVGRRGRGVGGHGPRVMEEERLRARWHWRPGVRVGRRRVRVRRWRGARDGGVGGHETHVVEEERPGAQWHRRPGAQVGWRWARMRRWWGALGGGVKGHIPRAEARNEDGDFFMRVKAREAAGDVLHRSGGPHFGQPHFYECGSGNTWRQPYPGVSFQRISG